jgi:polyhydroxybutyrate depolymerase
MRLMVRAAVVLGLLLAMCSPGLAEELQIETRDGIRTAILRPAPRRRAPTVVVLHGALVSAEYTEQWYGFAEAAKRHGFAAVYPRGLSLLWNDGRAGTWGSVADDVGFLKRLSGELVKGGIADPERLYLIGVSNGGMLALRMLCEAPELFAGIATVIASMPEAVGAKCRSRPPLSVIMLNGTADPVIPYRGGQVGFSGLQGRVWPVERTAAFLAARNGCTQGTKAVVSDRAAPGAIRVVKLDWRRCSSQRGVTLYRVEGGGHQVFGATNFLPFMLGAGTRRVSAPAVIMAAFSKGEL